MTTPALFEELFKAAFKSAVFAGKDSAILPIHLHDGPSTIRDSPLVPEKRDVTTSIALNKVEDSIRVSQGIRNRGVWRSRNV